MASKQIPRKISVSDKNKSSSNLSVTLIKKLFNLIDKEDKGEINSEEFNNFISLNNLNDDLIYIKKVFEESSEILKLKLKDCQQLCKNYLSLYSTKIEKMIDNLSKILSDLDFSYLYFNISFKHLDHKNNDNFETLFYNEEAGEDYYSESNLIKDEDRCYIKINRKYYKMDKNKYNMIYINFNSPKGFIDLELNDGLNAEKYKIYLEKNIVQFFEGNTLNGILNKYMFEISLEIKEDKNEIKNLNESVYVVESRTSANTNFDLGFNKKNQTTIHYNESNQDTIKIIMNNYLEYYYRNFASINKFRIYKEILDSLDFKEKIPNKEDFKIINKLFSISYDNSDKNTKINNLSVNDTSNFSNNKKDKSIDDINSKISFSKKILKANKSINFGKKETINIEEELLKSENMESKSGSENTNNRSNLKSENPININNNSNDKFIDKKIKSLFNKKFENTFQNHKTKSFLTLMNFSIGINYFLYSSNEFKLVNEYMNAINFQK